MGVALNLANASAAGTTAGAPTPMSVGPQQNPAVGSNQPNPPVTHHAGQKSVGTHDTQDPNKRSNPVHGMTK